MMKKQITNKWAVGLTAVLAMAMLCGCGAGADSAGNYKSEAPAAATEAAYDGLYEEYGYAEEELAVEETAGSGECVQSD